MRKRIQSTLRQGLESITFVVIAFVFVLNIIYRVTVSYDNEELVTIQHALGSGFASLMVLVVSFAAVFLLKDKLAKKQEESLFKALSVIYCIVVVYMILNVDNTLRADAGHVSETAIKLLSGNLDAFQNGYLNMYPHQIGLVLYDALLDCFSKNPAIQFVMNFLFVLGTNYLLCSISRLLFDDHFTTILTILLSFCFLPQLFFILFAYNNIPSFFFLTLAFYNLLKYTSSGRTGNIIAVVLGATIAVFLRKNTMIGVIAMIIYLLLDLLKKYSPKHLLMIVLLVLGTVFPSDMVYSYFQQKTSVQNAGIPTVLWVAMGTDIDNYRSGPGWNDRSTKKIYEMVNRDPERAYQVGIEKIEENIQKIQENPRKSMKFFCEKIVSQWCDPLFQSVWSGPLESSGQYTHTKLLQSLHNGGVVENTVGLFCRIYSIGMWCLATFFLVKDSKKTLGWELAFLYLIGGFLFHIIWEAKSQYIYQYLLALVPFCAYSLSRRIKEVVRMIL